MPGKYISLQKWASTNNMSENDALVIAKRGKVPVTRAGQTRMVDTSLMDSALQNSISAKESEQELKRLNIQQIVAIRTESSNLFARLFVLGYSIEDVESIVAICETRRDLVPRQIRDLIANAPRSLPS